jgi:glutamate synthase (NADPH) small chain
MPSFCPKCHSVLDQDEICCAQVHYTWRCRQCHKLTTGFALPYGSCFLCGGEVEQAQDRDLGDPLRFEAIRQATQFELNSYHFYRLAVERTGNPQHRVILEQLYENELDHLHELKQKYHLHLDDKVLLLHPAFEELLADRLFSGIDFNEDSGAAALYRQAIEMERRTRDHFRLCAGAAPQGFEKELYEELAAEEEEHIAMLETEMAQFE